MVGADGGSFFVRAASIGNLTLSATQTVDGVSLAVGDLILVKDQTAVTENGAYSVKTSTWRRIAIPREVTVESGTTNAASMWAMFTAHVYTQIAGRQFVKINNYAMVDSANPTTNNEGSRVLEHDIEAGTYQYVLEKFDRSVPQIRAFTVSSGNNTVTFDWGATSILARYILNAFATPITADFDTATVTWDTKPSTHATEINSGFVCEPATTTWGRVSGSGTYQGKLSVWSNSVVSAEGFSQTLLWPVADGPYYGMQLRLDSTWNAFNVALTNRLFTGTDTASHFVIA